MLGQLSAAVVDGETERQTGSVTPPPSCDNPWADERTDYDNSVRVEMGELTPSAFFFLTGAHSPPTVCGLVCK